MRGRRKKAGQKERGAGVYDSFGLLCSGRWSVQGRKYYLFFRVRKSRSFLQYSVSKL